MRVFCYFGIFFVLLYGCFDFSDISERNDPETPVANCEFDTDCSDGACIDNRCVESVAGCDPGFEADPSANGSCVDIDECITRGEAAPCSPLTECMNTLGGFACTACPEGYEDETQSGEACTPTLLGLNLSAFVSLDSEFAPSQRDYTVTFRSWLDQFEARFTIPSGSELLSEAQSIDDPNRVTLEADSVAGISVPFTVQSHGLGTTYNLTFEERRSGFALGASSLGDEDEFGEAVAVADGIIVVGARFDDGPDPDGIADALRSSGAAYVFERDAAGTWEERALLRASNLSESDQFGSDVAVADGVIVVGAVFEDGPDADASGAAYVFERNADGTWEERALLRASNLGDADLFGSAVAVGADVIVIGAPSEDGPDTGGMAADIENDSGAAYVFERNGNGEWEERALLRASNPGTKDFFGGSLAVAADEIVVGASWEDGPDASGTANAVSNSGAVYVFERNGSGIWEERSLIRASNPNIGVFFGNRIAMTNDVMVVGATGDNGPDASGRVGAITKSGAAYVFERNASGTWVESALLRASNLGRLDGFGGSVAMIDGVIVVGASEEDGPDPSGVADAVENSGAAYVFERNSAGTWVERALLRAVAFDESDRFGAAVAIADGVIVIGANDEDGADAGVANALERSGAAHAF
ncbi:MAG: hypothetical protein AAFQ65_01420 [Myxococcota bacterium]